MNKHIILKVTGCLVVLFGLLFVLTQQLVRPMLNDRMVEVVVEMPIVVEEYKFGFTYPSGIEGFALVEPPVATTSQSLRKAYLLFENSQYREYQTAQGSMQTPPAVSVFVFTLPEKSPTDTASRSERLMKWIENNPQYASFHKKVGDVTEVDMDGLTAIKYSTEGIYHQDFHIVSYSGYAYVFAGQYENTEDEHVAMYTKLIDSVTFY